MKFNPAALTVTLALACLMLSSGLAAPVRDIELWKGRSDLSALANLTAAELAGEASAHPMVEFAPAAREQLRKEAEVTAGLGAPRHLLTRFAASEAHPGQAEVGFVFTYVDPLLRRASMSVLLRCEFAPGKITVHAAQALPAVAPEVATKMFIVPETRVPRDLLQTNSHAEILMWLAANAIKEQEMKADPEPCYIFALTMDRLKGRGRIGLAVDSKAEGAPAPHSGSRTADYEGWQIAVLHGTFQWRRDPEFFIKTVVLPPEGAPEAAPQLLATLSSELPEPVPISSGASLRLPPVADTHVFAYDFKKWSGSNWGKYDVLAAGWHPTRGEKRIYMRFDLSDVDPAQVAGARLRLYHYVTVGEAALGLGVHEVTSGWVEGAGNYPPASDVLARPGELTWLAQPTYGKEAAATFNPGGEANRFVEIDVTELVKGWLAGKPNHGLAIAPGGELRPDVEQSGYGFFSRERDDIDKRPALIIERPAAPAAIPPGGGD